MTQTVKGDYAQMWNDFAKNKSKSYLTDKYSASNIVGLTGMAREHEIFRQLSLQEDDMLLDVGCASGHQVFRAAAICRKAVGIDIGDEFIDTALAVQKEQGITNVEFLKVKGDVIPFPDETFDKLICSEVLEHVDDHHVFLDEIKRVVKKGGTLVLTVPNWNNRGTFYKRLKNRFRAFPFTPISDFSMEGIRMHGDAHVRQFTINTFSDFVGSHGLDVVYVGGAAFIDAPKIGPIISIINRWAFMRWLSFAFERFCGSLPFLKCLGRHVILKAQKN